MTDSGIDRTDREWVDDGGSEPKSGTFLVRHADEESAVLLDVETSQVHTIDSNPGLEAAEAMEATIEPVPPLEVAWTVAEIERSWSVTIERSEEPPTTQERSIAEDQPIGELTRQPRAGTGELHVITVPPERTEQAVDDVATDRETTLARAARLGVERVEIRSEPGIVCVRYLP